MTDTRPETRRRHARRLARHLSRRRADARSGLPRQIAASADAVARIVAKGEPVYGINTGFGKLASVRIRAADLETLQRNIVLQPCRRRRRADAGCRSRG